MTINHSQTLYGSSPTSATLKPLSMQSVVVFGASSGMGRGTALALAHSGAKVMVAARGARGLESLVKEIRQAGGTAEMMVADAASFEQVQAVAQRAYDLFGSLDTWIHTAAVSIYATFEETTPEEFQQILNVNLMGQVHGALAALPFLRLNGRGALIFLGSVESQLALPYQSAYAASKHGTLGFTDALRIELANEGMPIAVTTIMPAGINTPFFDKARTKLGVLPKPIAPVYQPETVISAIVHAAEHPATQVVVGDAGKLLAVSKRIAPRFTDWMLEQVGFSGQRTDIPKRAEAASNLNESLEEMGAVHGQFGTGAFPVSLTNELERFIPLPLFFALLGLIWIIGGKLKR